MNKFIFTISIMAGIIGTCNVVGVLGSIAIDAIQMKLHPENYIPEGATLEEIHNILNEIPKKSVQPPKKGVELI